MKDGVKGILTIAAICAAIVAAVFGLLGGVVDLDFVTAIAWLACKIFALCIYAHAALWVISFDWSEAPFLKASGAGVLLAVLSYIVYDIFGWGLFYWLYIVCAVVAALAVVIGLIKTIFDV